MIKGLSSFIVIIMMTSLGTNENDGTNGGKEDIGEKNTTTNTIIEVHTTTTVMTMTGTVVEDQEIMIVTEVHVTTVIAEGQDVDIVIGDL